MTRQNAVYTEKAQCQDCYKCVRHCPVKSIKVENGHAIVSTEDCILCGNCVNVCPVGAKRIRNDLPWAQQLLKTRSQVFVSLAPSWVTEFPELSPEKLIAAIRKLGFAGVSETALGAQMVSANAAELLRNGKQNILISSACPVIVEFISKYYPTYASALTPLLSPALTHARYLKEIYGEQTGIVFIGPCIAKKRESELHTDLMDVALTFEDLKTWLETESINPKYLQPEENDCFVPMQASEGNLYPVDGGMIDGIRHFGAFKDVHFMAISGGAQITCALDGLDQVAPERKVFIEMLACDGGCINGPRAANQTQTAIKRIMVHDNLDESIQTIRTPEYSASEVYHSAVVQKQQFSPVQISTALRRLGKIHPVDELNCGGCGYNSCRDFAQALLRGKAETSMCVSYMRKLAMNKANALIKAMPSGVVIVDDQLRIIECNKHFVELVGDDAISIYEVNPGLEGAYLNRLVPFHKHFQQIMSSDEPALDKELRYKDKIIRLLIFPIEKQHIVGAIMQDITTPTIHREQIINKSEQLIKQNLTTVQQIAFLLGENAAESQILLNSIIESFSGKQ